MLLLAPELHPSDCAPRVHPPLAAAFGRAETRGGCTPAADPVAVRGHVRAFFDTAQRLAGA